MNIVTETESYETIRVRTEGDICYLQLYRPNANNTINDRLIAECGRALRDREASAKIIVLEGLPEVFCFGADFRMMSLSPEAVRNQDPSPLYDVWQQLASGPYITIAHVRGKANAGGVGFAAACDLVLSEERAVFSLSELLFGLMPACVLPFLIRRIGFSKANYMTLMTQPVPAARAHAWGLVDACEEDSDNLVRRHLLRLRRLSKTGVARYKRYMGSLDPFLPEAKPNALKANMEVFSDLENLEKISRYVKTGIFPWEGD